jgi:hypothetical protein
MGLYVDAVSSNDRVGSPKKTENSQSMLEITKITLQLAGDLPRFACRSGVWCMAV